MAIQPTIKPFKPDPSLAMPPSKTDAVLPSAAGKKAAANSTSPSSVAAAAGAGGAVPKRSSVSASVLSRKANPEKRANHNAIERARRESLNSRFLILAASIPAISEIRRPSKSLIVNRSLQFVVDALAREQMYRSMITDMHARNRELVEQLNEYKRQAGQHALAEPLPPMEVPLPRSMADAEKERPRSRPKNGVSGSGNGSVNGGGDGLGDDYDDFDGDDSFPLPAGGLDAFSIGSASSLGGQDSPFLPSFANVEENVAANNNNASVSAAAAMLAITQAAQNQNYLDAAGLYLQSAIVQQQQQLASMPAFIAPSHLRGPGSSIAASGSPTSPPALSPTATSPGSTVSSHSAPAMAHSATAGLHHLRASTAPAPAAASLPPTSAAAVAAAALYASAAHGPHSPACAPTGGFDFSAFLAHSARQNEQQQAFAAAHAAAAQAIAAQQRAAVAAQQIHQQQQPTTYQQLLYGNSHTQQQQPQQLSPPQHLALSPQHLNHQPQPGSGVQQQLSPYMQSSPPIMHHAPFMTA